MTSITDMIKNGLKYPFNDTKNVLIFGIILAIIMVSVELSNFLVSNSFSSLIFVLLLISLFLSFIVCGYLYNVMKYAIEGKYEVPGLENILETFVNGVKLTVLLIAYLVLPIILLMLGLLLTVNQSVGSSVNAIGMVILLIAVLFIIFMVLLFTMASCHMIKNDSFKAAFRFKEIYNLISAFGWIRYIGAVLLTNIVTRIIAIFFGLLFAIFSSLFGAFFGSTLIFAILFAGLTALFIDSYICTASYRIYGTIYREAIAEPLD